MPPRGTRTSSRDPNADPDVCVEGATTSSPERQERHHRGRRHRERDVTVLATLDGNIVAGDIVRGDVTDGAISYGAVTSGAVTPSGATTVFVNGVAIAVPAV